MKCLYIYIAIFTYILTVISAAVPEDICETCVPTQDCPLFENLSYRDQLLWMEMFPCGSLPKTNDFKVPAGFASAAKGDYVCCSNNIWGIEKPEYDSQIGPQSSNNNNTNPSYSNLGDYSNTENINKFDTIDDSPIYFPDWDDYSDNKIITHRPGNSNNYWNTNNGTNKPTDYNIYFPNNNNPNTNELDDNNLHTVNNSQPNVFEISDGGSTIWFPNRTQNYDNTDYWLTHDPRNNSNKKPDQNWSVRSTERTPFYNIPNRPTTDRNNIYHGNNEITPRPFFRNPDYNRVRNSPFMRYPSDNKPVNNPGVNIPRPPNQLYRYPGENSRPPVRNWPPNPPSQFPPLFNPSEDIYRSFSYPPRQNSRFPPRNIMYPHNILPRQPLINNDRPQKPYDYDQERNDNTLTNNGLYYNTEPSFDDYNQGNFGGSQCARLTSFPPDPQSNCCGLQLADSDRITDRPPQYNQPAYTNYWDRSPFDSARIWNTRDEVSVDGTDEDVTVERRISGGQATELYQYPWTVLLLTTFDYGTHEAAFNCGGGLISARFVLTAGHCVYDKGASVKSVQVNLAEYDKRTFPKDCKSTRNGRQCIENIVMYAEHIITHPQYDNENLVNDIALIRVRGSAPYTDYIRPICLPSFNIDEPQFSNLQFEVAGWGRNGPYSSDVKQSTYLHLMNHNQCKMFYPQLTNRHLCAAGQRGADTCKGDSGGPLMILYRGRYYVAGIVSGKRADSPCGTAVPSLYTNVYHYVDWIRTNIRNQS